MFIQFFMKQEVKNAKCNRKEMLQNSQVNLNSKLLCDGRKSFLQFFYRESKN